MTDSSHPTFHPTKILVPMDFSSSSISALAAAIEVAQQFHAELYLLHVITMQPIVTGMEFPTAFYPREEVLIQTEKDSEKRFAEFVADLSGQGTQANSRVEVAEDVVGSVLITIPRENIDMLGISTHGMSGWRPVVFGSIAEKVIKLAECPVLLLRSTKTKDMNGHKGAK